MQLAWLNWRFDALLVSHFVFWCGNPGCALIQLDTCVCDMYIISRFVINWHFRRTVHYGSHKPVSVLSPGMPQIGSWQGHCLCSFKEGAMGAGVPFHNSITGNLIDYQDRLETILFQLFAHSENLEWFSIISVIVFEVNIVDEQIQT